MGVKHPHLKGKPAAAYAAAGMHRFYQEQERSRARLVAAKKPKKGKRA